MKYKHRNNKLAHEVYVGQLWMYSRNRKVYEVADIRSAIVHMREYNGLHKRYTTVSELLYSDDWLDVAY